MRVLVAVDGGRYSEEIMEAVAHLVRAEDEVHLLSVVAPSEVRDTAGGPPVHAPANVATATGQLIPTAQLRRGYAETGAQAVARALGERRAHLQALAHRVPGAPAWQIHVEVDDDPAAAILALAERTSAHGVAMGTRGRGGVVHALLGSVAETVVRQAAVPVLVVRDGLEVPPPPAVNGA